MTDRPPPDEAGLREAALSYLARYAATRETLRRVLLRRIDRWVVGQPDQDAAATVVEPVRVTVERIVAQLTEQGMVNDAAFTESRGLGLLRAGVSRRGAIARLAQKGIAPGLALATLPRDMDTELAAALVLTRKRRIGPFRTKDARDEAVRRREFGIMARAGFPATVARRALDMDADEAETRIRALRQ